MATDIATWGFVLCQRTEEEAVPEIPVHLAGLAITPMHESRARPATEPARFVAAATIRHRHLARESVGEAAKTP